MKATLIALGGFLVLLMFIVGVAGANYVSFHDQGVNYETRLEAEWTKSKNTLSTYTTKVQEVAQVPDMFRDDLLKVVEATFQGRYGKDGSKAVFQMIQEKNMNLDPLMYRQIQQVMESGRNDFQASQNAVIDIKRSYETQLGKVWSGFWLGVAGYPKVDLTKYKVVILQGVSEKFDSGKDEVIKLR
jgi:hypothetical protein